MTFGICRWARGSRLVQRATRAVRHCLVSTAALNKTLAEAGQGWSQNIFSDEKTASQCQVFSLWFLQRKEGEEKRSGVQLRWKWQDSSRSAKCFSRQLKLADTSLSLCLLLWRWSSSQEKQERASCFHQQIQVRTTSFGIAGQLERL